MPYTEKEVLDEASKAVTKLVSDLEESGMSFEQQLECLSDNKRLLEMTVVILAAMLENKLTPENGVVH